MPISTFPLPTLPAPLMPISTLPLSTLPAPPWCHRTSQTSCRGVTCRWTMTRYWPSGRTQQTPYLHGTRCVWGCSVFVWHEGGGRGRAPSIFLWNQMGQLILPPRQGARGPCSLPHDLHLIGVHALLLLPCLIGLLCMVLLNALPDWTACMHACPHPATCLIGLHACMHACMHAPTLIGLHACMHAPTMSSA